MDEIVAILIGVFIANYNTKEHPYVTSLIKAFLIALMAFIFFIVKDLISDDLNFGRLIKGALGVWFILSIWLCLMEFLFKKK